MASLSLAIVSERLSKSVAVNGHAFWHIERHVLFHTHVSLLHITMIRPPFPGQKGFEYSERLVFVVRTIHVS